MANEVLQYRDMEFKRIKEPWTVEHCICEAMNDVAELVEGQISTDFPQLSGKIGSSRVSLFSIDNGKTNPVECEAGFLCDLKLRIQYSPYSNQPSKEALEVAYEVRQKVLELSSLFKS